LDYIDHPKRVAARVNGDPEKAVAWLHDVLEDTDATGKELEELGLPLEVINAVVLLTRSSEVIPEDYYAAIRADQLALAVKLADIADNLNPARLAVLDTKTQERLRRKYHKGLTALEAGETPASGLSV
jgi:(p)ppGpp synthase/HD superfamily hydrolase